MNEEEEERGEEESEEVRYGPPTTEEEPEPHDVRNERPMVEPDSEIEGHREDDDEFGLRPHAGRLTALLRHEEALLEMAYSQGEFEDAQRIEANINHLEGLLMELPAP